jgi:hypothetical protein
MPVVDCDVVECNARTRDNTNARPVLVDIEGVGVPVPDEVV